MIDRNSTAIAKILEPNAKNFV